MHIWDVTICSSHIRVQYVGDCVCTHVSVIFITIIIADLLESKLQL